MRRNQRHKSREWKDARYPHWTCRAQWFEVERGRNIRLRFEDCDGARNVYCGDDVARANQHWADFKAAATADPTRPIIAPLFLR